MSDDGMTYTGYHFHNGRERYGSQRKIEAGKTYRVKGPPVLCEHGLHASARLIDALRYATPNTKYVSVVELGGTVVLDTDKAVATQRTVLKMADVAHTLHEFACWCAERALKAERKAGREPDKRSWEAIRVKRRWLKGEATNKELAAASAAAEAAAEDARAAEDAAWDAAWAASEDAAWAAAWAARAAAWATPRSAAWSVARAAQNRKLTAMVNKLLEAIE